VRPTKYLRLVALYWPWALVLGCGLTLGYFIVRTYVAPLPRQYQLNFGDAKWIEPPQFSPVAYFRKSLFLSSAPEQAWLQVAATDSFKLIVNGHSLGDEKSLKTRVAGIYDIKAALAAGTNVIGIEVSRISYPGSAQLLVRGSVKQSGHNPLMLLSDAQWKVTPDTGIVEGSEEWYSPLLHDEAWPNAHLATITEHSIHINWISTNPLLLHLPPAGNWLLARDAPRQAIFSTSLAANRSGQETWIQVASSGKLDLLVNGRLVTTLPTAPLNSKKLPRLAPATLVSPKTSEQEPSSDLSTANASSAEPLNLEAYDISRWIRRGSNVLVAAVRSDLEPATFLAEGFTVRRNGAVERFQTDATWRLLGLSSSSDSLERERVVEAGPNGCAPWGYLKEGKVKEPRLTEFDTIAKSWAVILGTILIVIAVWIVGSWSAAVLREESVQTAMVRDALFHVPITIALLFILLFGYDYRFPSNWPFQPVFCLLAIVALVTVRLLHLLASSPRRPGRASVRKVRQLGFRQALPYLILIGIMALGFILRYHDLGFMSFDHDEMGMVQKSKGVLERGFPYNEVRGNIKPAVTYELVPYPLAFSGWLFGYSDWSMRLPACLMGTLCIGVIILMGRRLFGWRTGLITGLVYACMTLDIRWGQNAFHPQQCQLFAMLTFWFFYEAISFRPLHRKYLTAASIVFCLSFLSWEGSGFILPSLFLALIVVRWSEWWWLKEWHLYRCLFFIAALIIAQFCWRTLASDPYVQIGSGLSNVTGPSLFFLSYNYQPTFYLEKLLLAESHVPFTLMIVAGILFCWQRPAFRYVVTLLGALVFSYTNLLAAISTRYVYFYQPLILLAAIAAAVMLYDRLVALARCEGNSLVGRSCAHAAGLGLILLLFVQSNEWLLKDYYLSGEGDAPALMNRLNTYRYDYRGAAQYVKNHAQPGDLIIPVISHVFENYSGLKGDFFLDALLSKKVTYDDTLTEPVFIEKFRGYPTLRSLTELQEVTHRGRRTWIVFVPSGALTKLSTPEILEYLDKNAKVVFESYRAKVFLIEGANQPSKVANAPSS
jgi:Dolichyl-phosphate-mannose-protein mannosyltransferase